MRNKNLIKKSEDKLKLATFSDKVAAVNSNLEIETNFFGTTLALPSTKQ